MSQGGSAAASRHFWASEVQVISSLVVLTLNVCPARERPGGIEYPLIDEVLVTTLYIENLISCLKGFPEIIDHFLLAAASIMEKAVALSFQSSRPDCDRIPLAISHSRTLTSVRESMNSRPKLSIPSFGREYIYKHDIFQRAWLKYKVERNQDHVNNQPCAI
jgi:hypothetical protein